MFRQRAKKTTPVVSILAQRFSLHMRDGKVILGEDICAHKGMLSDLMND